MELRGNVKDIQTVNRNENCFYNAIKLLSRGFHVIIYVYCSSSYRQAKNRNAPANDGLRTTIDKLRKAHAISQHG